MRREDRKISEKEALEILKIGEFGVLSMVTPDQEGYGIPLNYALQNNEIYFHCALEGLKLDFLKYNNIVSFCVVGKSAIISSEFGTMYESAIVSGTIAEVYGEEKRIGLMRIIEKYSGNYIPEGVEYIEKLFDKVRVIKLSIASLTGKARKSN
ncbi:MAG: pyridoxamine 5'-phosphate oxidase family protein [Methanobacterium sp.]